MWESKRRKQSLPQGSGQVVLAIQKVKKIRMFNFSDSRSCGLHAVLPPPLGLTLTLSKENFGSSSLVRSVRVKPAWMP